MLDANPLEDISNVDKIDVVFLRGRIFRRGALDNLLVKAEQSIQ
jgi:hypothetical protein